MVVRIRPGALANPVETAALIANLDLVVTADPGHGPSGRGDGQANFPALADAADWRWLPSAMTAPGIRP